MSNLFPDYEAALERLKKFEDAPHRQVPKVTEAPFVTSVTPPQGTSADFHSALSCLWTLYREHRARLETAGYDPSGARVRVADWRKRCRLDDNNFNDMLEILRSDGRVIVEGCYVRPGVIQECAPEASATSDKRSEFDPSAADEP